MKSKQVLQFYLYLALLILLITSCKTEQISLEKNEVNLRSYEVFGPVTETPRPASDFVNAIGVNTHLRFATYKGKFDNIIYPRLKELGIKHIRDAVPYKDFMYPADTIPIRNQFIKLYDSLGIKFNYVLDSKLLFDNASLRNSAAYLSIFRQSTKLRESIQTLEGMNEPDLNIYAWDTTVNKTKWAQITYDIQKGLYNGAKAAPELNTIPIVSTSLTAYWQGRPAAVAAISPHISTLFDYANFHCYDTGSQNWKMFPATYYDLSKSMFPQIQQGKPYVITETGYENARYYNLPGSSNYAAANPHYLSELSSGKYYSVLFMEELKRGAKNIYAYEFLDQNTADQNSNENNYGLIHTDGTPKPAFTAIKNTIALLKDSIPAFVPTSTLQYTITGDTVNIRRMLFQKSDGKYYLALWQGHPAVDQGTKPNGMNYNYTTFQDLPADTQNVTITLNQPYSTAKTYMPMVSVSPTYSDINVTTINIAVPDQLLILELKL